MEVLIAKVAGGTVAIPMAHLLRTLDIGTVTPLPGAPAQVSGVVVLDMDVIPAVDIGHLFDAPCAIENRCGIIIESDVGHVALLVDEIGRKVVVETQDHFSYNEQGVAQIRTQDDAALLIDVASYTKFVFAASWDDLAVEQARLADEEVEIEEACLQTSPFLLVETHARVYAIALRDVVQVVRDVTPASYGTQNAIIRGRYWWHGFGLETICAKTLLFGQAGPETTDVVVLRSERGRFALAVDSILGIRHCTAQGEASEQGLYWSGYVTWEDEGRAVIPAAILIVAQLAENVEGSRMDEDALAAPSRSSLLPNFLGLRINEQIYLVDPQRIDGIRARHNVIFSPAALESEQGSTVLAEIDQRFAGVIALPGEVPTRTLGRPFWAEFRAHGSAYLLGIDRLIGFKQVPQNAFEKLAGSDASYTILDDQIATRLDLDQILSAVGELP